MGPRNKIRSEISREEELSCNLTSYKCVDVFIQTFDSVTLVSYCLHEQEDFFKRRRIKVGIKGKGNICPIVKPYLFYFIWR